MVGLNCRHNFQFSILFKIFRSHLLFEVVVPHFGLVSARIEVLGDINLDRFLKSWELQNEMNFQIIRGNVLLGNVNEISKWKTTEDRVYIFPGVQMQKLEYNTNYQRMPPAYKTTKIIFESLSFITIHLAYTVNIELFYIWKNHQMVQLCLVDQIGQL